MLSRTDPIDSSNVPYCFVEKEKPFTWKKQWRGAIIAAAVVFFLFALLLPLDEGSFFALSISAIVHIITIAIFLVRRLKTPTKVDLFMVSFGLIIYVFITFTSFQILDHAIPK